MKEFEKKRSKIQYCLSNAAAEVQICTTHQFLLYYYLFLNQKKKIKNIAFIFLKKKLLSQQLPQNCLSFFSVVSFLTPAAFSYCLNFLSDKKSMSKSNVQNLREKQLYVERKFREPPHQSQTCLNFLVFFQFRIFKFVFAKINEISFYKILKIKISFSNLTKTFTPKFSCLSACII